VVAAALSGCGESGGNGPATNPNNEPTFRDPDLSGGTPIKVSYVRFNEEQDSMTRVTKFKHHYRYMLSRGWKNRRGPRSHEPFERLRWTAYKAEEVPDNVMEELVKRLMALGFGDLRETPLDRINLEELRRIEKMNDRVKGQRTRFITVETETFKKTVAYYDNDDSRGGKMGPLTQKFIAVETEALNVMQAYTVFIEAETDSSMPRGKRQ
ncbi:MAG TPA: hypothetical protein VJU16_07245, partial [Planctomycetota bacterium]|nr:hypothetical protein [Planctomycetota bacterium]